MNRYPISRTNEKAVMGLCFHVRDRVWQPLAERDERGKHLFGGSELDDPGTTWRDFHLLESPVTGP